MSSRGGDRNCPGSESTRITASKQTRAPHRSPISSKDVRSSSFTTSCSGPISWRGAHLARRSPTASTALWFTLQITTCRSGAVPRAPLAKLQAYKKRMGWSFPWASSSDSNFKFDFRTSQTKEQQQPELAKTTSRRATCGRCWRPATRVPGPAGSQRAPGRTRRRICESCPALARSCSRTAWYTTVFGLRARRRRPVEVYQWLDRAPRGRNETSTTRRGSGATTSTGTDLVRKFFDILMDEGDRHAALADARGDAFHRAVANVARRKDSGNAGFEQIWVARPGAVRLRSTTSRPVQIKPCASRINATGSHSVSGLEPRR